MWTIIYGVVGSGVKSQLTLHSRYRLETSDSETKRLENMVCINWKRFGWRIIQSTPLVWFTLTVAFLVLPPGPENDILTGAIAAFTSCCRTYSTAWSATLSGLCVHAYGWSCSYSNTLHLYIYIAISLITSRVARAASLRSHAYS